MSTTTTTVAGGTPLTGAAAAGGASLAGSDSIEPIEHQPVEAPVVRLLLACEVRLYREGLAQSLTQRASSRMHVVATAADGSEALRLTRALQPDLALLDAGLPDSVAIAREIVRQAPGTRVLALAINESDRNVIEIAEAGLAGYVPRDASHDDLIAAIERTARGEVLCPPSIVASLFRRMATRAGSLDMATGLSGLTPREQDVVELLRQGLSNKEIARRLTIRVATVKNHVHSVLKKLGVTRRVAVAALVRDRDV